MKHIKENLDDIIVAFILIIIPSVIIFLGINSIYVHDNNLVCPEIRVNLDLGDDECTTYFEKCSEQARTLWNNIKQRNTENGTQDKQSEEINKYIDKCLSEFKK